MAHKLHDINGMLIVGIDVHEGIHWPTPLPAPMLFGEINAAHPFVMGANQQPTVMFNGVNSVVDMHAPKLLWPHFPVWPDPLNLLFPLDILMGQQQCWLPRGQVHICGTPAAPTVFPAPLSINLDCWMVGNVPTSLIFQPGTVETTPSASDYKTGIVRAAVALAIDAAFYFLTRSKKTYNTRKGWGNLGQNLRTTFTSPSNRRRLFNKIGREFASKLTPFQWKDSRWQFDVTDWRSALSFAKDATGFHPGQAAAGGPTGLPSSPLDVLKNAIPGSGNVIDAFTGLRQGGVL